MIFIADSFNLIIIIVDIHSALIHTKFTTMTLPITNEIFGLKTI